MKSVIQSKLEEPRALQNCIGHSACTTSCSIPNYCHAQQTMPYPDALSNGLDLPRSSVALHRHAAQDICAAPDFAVHEVTRLYELALCTKVSQK